MKLIAYLFVAVLISSSTLAINQAVLPEVRAINTQEGMTNFYVDNLPVHMAVQSGEITAYTRVDMAKTLQVETPSLTQSLDVPIRNNKAYTIMNLKDRIWVLQDDYKNVQFGYTKLRVINLGNTSLNVSYDNTTIFSNVGYAKEPNNVQVNAGRHNIEVTTNSGIKHTFTNQQLVDRAIYTIFYINDQVIIKKDYQLWQK